MITIGASINCTFIALNMSNLWLLHVLVILNLLVLVVRFDFHESKNKIR